MALIGLIFCTGLAAVSSVTFSDLPVSVVIGVVAGSQPVVFTPLSSIFPLSIAYSWICHTYMHNMTTVNINGRTVLKQGTPPPNKNLID